MRATWAPASARARTTLRPMPRAPPVTAATLPLSWNRERTGLEMLTGLARGIVV